MASETTYKVSLQYDLKGGATAGLKGMEAQAHKTSAGLGGIKSILAGLAGGALVGGIKKYMIDSNVEMTRMQIGMASVMSMNLHLPFARAKTEADKLFDSFQKMAVASPATTRDFVEMSSMISGAVFQAGLGIKDLGTLTNGAVIAAAALGTRSDMLAGDIRSMLTGQVNAFKDRSAVQLLASQGITDLGKYNKDVRKDGRLGASVTKKALESDTIKEAAKAYGESFEGVTSTLKENIEVALRKTGLPLMKAIGAEVSKWNKWMVENPAKMQQIMDKVSGALVSGFGAVRDAIGFLIDNRDTIMTIGKIWLAVKVGSAINGAIGSMTGTGKGLLGSLSQFAGHNVNGAKVSGPMTAAQSLAGGGLGRAGGQGLSGVLGPAMSALTFGYALGTVLEENTGIGKSFGTELAKLTGRFTALDQMSADTASSMGHVDRGLASFTDALARARASTDPPSAKKTKTYLRGKVATNSSHSAAEAIAAYQSGLDAMGSGTMATTRFNGKSAREQFAEGSRQGLLGAGVHENDIKTLMGGGDKARLALLDKYNTKTSDKSARFESMAEMADAVKNDSMAKLTEEQKAGVDQMKLLEDVMKLLSDNVAYMSSPASLESMTDGFIKKQAAEAAGTMGKPKSPSTNVTINKIEVASNDPDRFVHGMVQTFDEVTRNPGGARDALRGGF